MNFEKNFNSKASIRFMQNKRDLRKLEKKTKLIERPLRGHVNKDQQTFEKLEGL